MNLSENYKKRLSHLAGLNENINKKTIGYHGTSAIFDQFKLSKAGSKNNAGDFGRGLYFSTDKDVAKAYADDSNGYILTVELDIKNPYTIDYQKFSDYKLKQESGEIDRNLINPEVQKYMDTLNDGGANFSLSDVKDEKNRYIDFFTISDNLGADKVAAALEKEGFDSVVVIYGTGKEIVVFNEKQTKISKREKVK